MPLPVSATRNSISAAASGDVDLDGDVVAGRVLLLQQRDGLDGDPAVELYADNGAIIDSLKNTAQETPPFIEMTDDQGHHHRVWRVVSPAVQRHWKTAFATERLYIADGHHRYETALDYRAWVAANDPAFGPDHPANFGRLCSKGSALAETVDLDGRLLYPEIGGERTGSGIAIQRADEIDQPGLDLAPVCQLSAPHQIPDDGHGERREFTIFGELVHSSAK